MKVLPLQPYWAMLVATANKFVECRTWKTDYRGRLLICASSQPWEAGTLKGHALCVVNLTDIVLLEEEPLQYAGFEEMPPEESYAWVFDGFSLIKSFEVKGKLHLIDVDDELIEYDNGSTTRVAFIQKYLESLVRWSDKKFSEEEARDRWGNALWIIKKFDELDAAESNAVSSYGNVWASTAGAEN